MMYGLSCCCECRQSLDITGGATETIFPAAEKLLQQTDYQKALEFVASRKSMDRYHSMMDFLFCEVYTKYRWGAFRYYNEKGPPLRKILTAEEIKDYDHKLVVVLTVAWGRKAAQMRQSWAAFAHVAREAAKAA